MEVAGNLSCLQPSQIGRSYCRVLILRPIYGLYNLDKVTCLIMIILWSVHDHWR
jgi:hypothetical protein